MKRLLPVFELTVAEQRVIVVFLLIFVLCVAYRTYSPAPKRAVPATASQPSPSPGILP